MFFCILFIFFFIYTHSQQLKLYDENNYELSNGDSLVITKDLESASELMVKVKIRNNSNQALEVYCKKIYLNVLPGTQDVFCWNNFCYSPSSFQSQPMTLNPNEIIENFSAIYYPNQIVGESKIMYVFKVIDGDSAYVIVKFKVIENSVPEYDLDNLIVFSSPFNESFFLDLNLNNFDKISFRLYDAYGRIICHPLTNINTGKLKINFTNLNKGVYILVINVNEDKIFTKKIIKL